MDMSIYLIKLTIMVDNYENIHAFTSLDRETYLNIIYYCDCFIGNSSSGICEVPLLKTVTFNLGNRQKGRACGNSVIHIDYHKEDIVYYINNIPKTDNITYPYM